MATATRPAGFVEGADYPSPVTHVVGLGFYDGVTNGVLRTADGAVYVFDVADDADPAAAGPRAFALSPLPAGTFEEVVRAIEPHIAPRWPCWVPVWKFPSEEVRAATDARLDCLLSTAGTPAWRVESADLLETVSATRTS
ncbi:MAG: hypothetical protein K2V38_13775 [Gemmataceae bacterium]|nr:hypothetical protein [Gemmataceae bacterium]